MPKLTPKRPDIKHSHFFPNVNINVTVFAYYQLKAHQVEAIAAQAVAKAPKEIRNQDGPPYELSTDYLQIPV